MTYQSHSTRSGTAILKALVVLTVIWVAYWASTGGLIAIEVPEPAPTTSTTFTE